MRRVEGLGGAHEPKNSACASVLHYASPAKKRASLLSHISRPTPSPHHKTLQKSTMAPLVGVIMGSDSDLPVMKAACEMLEKFKIEYECTIVSAHRTPDRLVEYARSARRRGLKVIVAGAGGAAHLPGMVAAMTPLPVVGVPVKTSALSGVDSLHSIVQMPRGVPVATVAIGNATNAGLLAARILATSNDAIGDALEAYAASQRDEVLGKAEVLEGSGWKAYLERKEAPKSTTVM